MPDFLSAFLLAATAPTVAPPAGNEPAAAVTQLFAPAGLPGGPGCAIPVRRGDATIFERAFGAANLEQPRPIRMDTIFEAGSVSKQFTAASIAVLAANRRLSLDDDIRRFLPEMRDFGSPISIRMLLTHSSGIRNWDDLVELAGAPRGERVYEQVDALRIIARQSALNFTPGSEYLYSNSNYVLAAIIVERASGKSFADLPGRPCSPRRA